MLAGFGSWRRPCSQLVAGAGYVELQEQIQRLPQQRHSLRKGRDRALRRRLKRMLGVDLMAIPTIVETALTVVGADLSRFTSVALLLLAESAPDAHQW